MGEIDDETDPLGGAVRRLPNGDWFVRGHVAITDLVDYGLDAGYERHREHEAADYPRTVALEHEHEHVPEQEELEPCAGGGGHEPYLWCRMRGLMRP